MDVIAIWGNYVKIRLEVNLEIWRDWNLTLTIDDVLRGQGADPKRVRQRGTALIEAASWALEEGLPLLEPAVLISERSVLGLRHESLLLEGGEKLKGALIGQHLGGTERIAIMMCTIGGQLESVSGELMHSEPLLAIALEGVGISAVEKLGTLAANRVEERVHSKGMQTSIPLSPGMVGWSVEEGQPQIFSLIPAGQIGVHATQSWMMSPRMTITQVVGAGKDISLKGRTCDYCNLREVCRYQDHYPEVHTHT